MSQPVIGFLGLGLMGACFVKRLLGQGYAVVGFDPVAAKVEAAVALGAERADSPMDVAARSDIVGCSVTTPENVATIVGGEQGLIRAGDLTGKVFVDHSTTPIEFTLELGRQLAGESGMAFVDAPVSGGPAAAEAGTLAIMAGGEDAALQAVSPVMQGLGTFTRMGGPGAGQATKLINQTLVLNNYVVMAEALRLAEAYDVDAARVPEALASGHAGSNMLPVMFERMINRDWAPQGFARQILKDLELLNDAAHAKNQPMPMSAQALTLYRMMVAQGKSELDGAAVFELLGSNGDGKDRA